MAISVILTFNSTAYDVSDYVVKESVELDESLFTNLSPNTSACKFKLARSCPYLDEIFKWNDSIQIAITNNGVAAFTGFLTDDPEMEVSPTGIGDVEISAEDPGIKLLKRAWTSTDSLATVFNGPVCDGTTPSTSFLHILAALAGVTLSSTLPTIAGTVNFSVADTDEDEYWDILEGVLSECLYTFYFNAAGELCLYALSGMQGTPTDYVTTQGTILSEGGTKPGIIVKKRRYNYREITVEFDETETVASEIVFKDTTNQSATHDCVISLSPGKYYPPTCDASTYAYIDYFLEDKRDLVSVASAASDFVYETGIVAEFAHLGKRARVRFYNGAATQKTITQIRVVGTNVIAVSSKSKQICGEAGKAKKKVTAKYIHAKADALALGNLLYYYYKNSASTYEFRSYLGTLYPATTLFPSTSLYPMGDPLSLGEIVRIYDPLWTGLDVNVVITGKKYILGRDGATYTAEGVNTINLGDIGTYVARTPATVPNVQKYPAEKPLTALTDAVDFDGQYGVYGGQRYVGTMPSTWALDDAGQTAAEVQAAVPVYVPQYLGAIKDGFPASAKEGDVYLLYSETPNTVTPPTIADPPDHRGVFRYTSGAWVWTQDHADILKAARDIVELCLLMDTADPPAALYGTEAEYGITTSINIAHIKAAIIDILRAGDVQIDGTLTSRSFDTVNPVDGATINAPTPTYWPGSALLTLCASLADGWHAVDSASTLDGKTISHAVKSSSNAVSLQSDDAEVIGTGYGIAAKTLTSGIIGKATLYVDVKNYVGGTITLNIRKNGAIIYSENIVSSVYATKSVTFDVALNDVLTADGYSYGGGLYFKNFRLSSAPGTIALWNSTDSSAIIYESTKYYNQAGTVNINSGTLTTSAIDDYWLGSALIASLAAKLSYYREIAVDGGTFGGSTPVSVYVAALNSVRITYAGSTITILPESYYNYAGDILLPDAEGRVLIGDPSAEGQYEEWPHNIPGGTNNILTWRNKKPGAKHTVTETRAPDQTSGDTEATHSLHAVHNSIDYVRDLSLHNYAGEMHVLDVFSNFSNKTLGDWKWYQNRRISAWQPSHAYVAGDMVYNDPVDGINKIYYCIEIQGMGISSSSGGPTGTEASYIVDGDYPNYVIWQYLGVETEAGNALYGDTMARLYSLGGSIWARGGQKITGFLHAASYTHLEIFRAISPAMPVITSEICVHGMIAGYAVSKAARITYQLIRFYGANSSGISSIDINTSSGTTKANVSLSW